MNKEIWKVIPGWENYEVSNKGRVRRITTACGTWKNRIHKALLDNGYPRALLSHPKKKRKAIHVHRLVMLAFVGPSNLHVNHINGIKTDNRLENLEYVTPLENRKHAARMGLMRHGAEVNTAKLSEHDIKNIRLDRRTQMEIAKDYKVSQTNISAIKRRETWKHIP